MNSNGTGLHVAAYTGDAAMASGRFRVEQYVTPLRACGVSLQVRPSWAGCYPPQERWWRVPWAVSRLVEAFAGAPASRRYDVVLFQRELFSTYVTAEPWYGRPRVLDVDDAIWVHRRGAFALRLARMCDAVICGNAYLANYFADAGRPVQVLPTGVDTSRFTPGGSCSGGPVIGWSGSSSNLRYIEALDAPLATVLAMFPDARVRVVCDRPPRFSRVPGKAIEYVRWSPEIEVAALQGLTVGLMPLEDSAWTRGKCAFKMLTYMSCGVPVVVSPLGMNVEVLQKGEVGLSARSSDEWTDAITMLLRDRDAAAQMGRTGRAVVESFYSVSALAPRFASILKGVAGA